MNAERRHFYLLVVVFSCLAVLLAVLAGSARAESASDGETTVLFILDGSGSMWGQIDDQAKITIAKDVMTDLVRDLPETIDVGLLAYGHRRKGDCKDIEILVPPGEGDSTSLTSAIQAITPKGKTPITRSLEVAAEQLRALEEEATVVLVSDGEETCEADPCARVRALKAEGINVTVHVVGFDVNDTERRQLTCIADAGGGRYFTADNAPQLQEAFREVKQEIVQKTEPQPAAETTKATQRTIAIAAGMIVAPRLQHDQVQVKDAESGTSIVMLSPKQTRTPVPAGSYAIELNGSMMTIEVAAGETVELPPPAVIKITNFDARTAVTVRNVDSGHGKILYRGEPSAEFWPGSYAIELNGSMMTIEVAAGETVELPPPAVIKIANFDAHGAGGTPVTVRNVDSGHGKILHRGEPSAEFWPGSYQVDLGKAFGGVHTVTVAAGEQLTFDLAGTQ